LWCSWKELGYSVRFAVLNALDLDFHKEKE
jgi:hypothetical protein